MKTNREEEIQPRTTRGQATVEFALVISVLFLVIWGIIEFSRVFFGYATMSHGVREGARYGVIHPGQDTEIIDLAQSRMVLIGSTAAVTVSYPDTSLSGGPHCAHFCRVVVQATTNFDPWTPLLPSFPMVAQATMHIE